MSDIADSIDLKNIKLDISNDIIVNEMLNLELVDISQNSSKSIVSESDSSDIHTFDSSAIEVSDSESNESKTEESDLVPVTDISQNPKDVICKEKREQELKAKALDTFNNARSSGSQSSINECKDEDKDIKTVYDNRKRETLRSTLSKRLVNNLLKKCNINSTDNTLKSIVDNLSQYIRATFHNYSMIESETLAKKYKKCIDAIIDDINKTLNLLLVSNQDQQFNTIVNIYNDTKRLLSSMPVGEDNTLVYLLKKIDHIIQINQNIIIITALWRKSESINIIVEGNMGIFHSLVDNVILPLKDDLEDINVNAMSYETRILTENVGSTPQKSRTNPSLNRTLSTDSTITKQMKKSKSLENIPRPSSATTPRSRHMSDSIDITTSSEIYYGDFTSDKQLSFNDVNEMINASYGNTDTLEASTAIDVLATYLKGQKVLYTEAKNYCERYLNILMIPAIVIAAVAGLLAQVWISYHGRLVVSILTAVNLLLLTLISFLKLDAKAEAHRTSAATYSTLEMKCEFLSGKIMYVDVEGGIDLKNEFLEIEKKVIETKTANSFVLPDYIVASYPEIYNTNIFSKVKILYTSEIKLRNDLKTTVNKLRSAAKIPNKTTDVTEKIEKLEALQDKQLTQIIEFRKQYLTIGRHFDEEIEKNVMLKQTRWCSCFGLINKLFCGACNRVILWYLNKQLRERRKKSMNLHYGFESVNGSIVDHNDV